MAVTTKAPVNNSMATPDLTDDEVKVEIIRELREGARTKGCLVDWTGYHRNTIGKHLQNLVYMGAVECVHEETALYELKEDPLENQ